MKVFKERNRLKVRISSKRIWREKGKDKLYTSNEASKKQENKKKKGDQLKKLEKER